MGLDENCRKIISWKTLEVKPPASNIKLSESETTILSINIMKCILEWKLTNFCNPLAQKYYPGSFCGFFSICTQHLSVFVDELCL